VQLAGVHQPRSSALKYPDRYRYRGDELHAMPKFYPVSVVADGGPGIDRNTDQFFVIFRP
jgi:hypothetical protein